MNLLQNASDDQVALLGCFVALAGSIALMYASYFVGPAARSGRLIDDAPDATSRLRMNLKSENADNSRERAA